MLLWIYGCLAWRGKASPTLGNSLLVRNPSWSFCCSTIWNEIPQENNGTDNILSSYYCPIICWYTVLGSSRVNILKFCNTHTHSSAQSVGYLNNILIANIYIYMHISLRVSRDETLETYIGLFQEHSLYHMWSGYPIPSPCAPLTPVSSWNCLICREKCQSQKTY